MSSESCANCFGDVETLGGFTLTDWSSGEDTEFCSRKCLVHFIATNVAEWSKGLNERLA
ncbi:hypothetical protein SEA_GUEY18_140 [Gordonia phage Guey18]|nr:hypothetical protein SEA_GUEY18_140 [Gordonia phage Guey18]